MLALPDDLSFESAAMTEPLACALRGLQETGADIGDTVTVIGAGPLGLMLVQVAKLTGCKVISVVKRAEQVASAKRFGADEVGKTQNPIDRVIGVTEGRGSDIVIEAVGRPQTWQWAVEMVRRGGVVNFFGGCASGTKVELDTNRLHYSEITLKATFHHTPQTVRKAFSLIAEKNVKSTDYVTGEAPLSKLKQVLQQMLDRGSQIKTAIIPGH
jgi:L-iditol 2-dehydrogenase